MGDTLSTTETIGDYDNETEQELAGVQAEADAFDAQEDQFDHSGDRLG